MDQRKAKDGHGSDAAEDERIVYIDWQADGTKQSIIRHVLNDFLIRYPIHDCYTLTTSRVMNNSNLVTSYNSPSSATET